MSNRPDNVSLDDANNAPLSLPKEDQKIVASVSDYKAAHEQVSTELFQLKEKHSALEVECNKLRLRADAGDILNKLIEPYAERAFWFMCVYAGFVGLVVFGVGVPGGFHLEASIVEFLVGSTAATVIGLVGMVLGGIFVNRPK